MDTIVPNLQVQTYYTPKFTEFQANFVKIEFFVNYADFLC